MLKPGLIATILLISLAASADAATHTARRHHRHPAQASPPRQIACTAIGCMAVPPGCSQTPGRTFSGMPSGFDVIVCPPGVQPIR